MPKLTSKGRKQIKKSNFALPKGTGSNKSRDQYPINDMSHARNALARVEQHGTPSEKAAVKRKVYAKYPSLKKGKKK